MERIVNGIVFEGKYSENQWEVHTWESNGVMERSARRVIEWREAYVLPFDYKLDPFDPVKDAVHLEEKRLCAKQRSAKRAKTACRRLIITAGFTELLTITYRDNQQDRELCKKHFKEWVRRMKRALGGKFSYVAAFEKQERGAWHIHVACHRLPGHASHAGSTVKGWQLGTKVWRSIVGENNGLVFVGGKTRMGTPARRRQSLAKLAQYVSKYILKGWETCPDEKNRYSRSDTLETPKPEKILLSCTFAELIAITFEVPPGSVVVDHKLPGMFKDSIWLVTEQRAG